MWWPHGAHGALVQELTDLIAERGKSGMIVSNNGTELTSNAVFAWAGEVGGSRNRLRPGKPMQNGSVESSNLRTVTARSLFLAASQLAGKDVDRGRLAGIPDRRRPVPIFIGGESGSHALDACDRY